MTKSLMYTGSLLLLCLLIGAGCGGAPKGATPGAPTAASKVIESGYFLSKKFLDGQGHLSDKYEYVLQSSTDYNKFIKLNNQIKISIDKENLTLTNADSPTDPHNSKLIYFSGFQQYTADKKLVNKMYSLNLVSNEIQEIFTHQDTSEEFKSGVTLRIVGREESNIIIKSDGINDSPGPCDNYWADPQANLSYLDLNDLKKGLQKYTVPKERVVQAEKEVQECMKSDN